jgi:hypothetical protein
LHWTAVAQPHAFAVAAVRRNCRDNLMLLLVVVVVVVPDHQVWFL